MYDIESEDFLLLWSVSIGNSAAVAVIFWGEFIDRKELSNYFELCIAAFISQINDVYNTFNIHFILKYKVWF